MHLLPRHMSISSGQQLIVEQVEATIASWKSVGKTVCPTDLRLLPSSYKRRPDSTNAMKSPGLYVIFLIVSYLMDDQLISFYSFIHLEPYALSVLKLTVRILGNWAAVRS